jgi:hypothetical protein
MLKKNVENVFTNRNMVLLFIALAVFTALQKFFGNHLNNYYIFTKPFLILLEGKSLYTLHYEYFYDYYRYSPAFALLMSPISIMPDVVGIVVWNLLNTLVLLSAIIYLYDIKNSKIPVIAMLIFLIEWLNACQNSQSNSLIAGLIVWGFIFLKNEKVWKAALMFSICGFIKFYGVAAAIMFVFFPKKPKFILAMTFWCIVLAFLPKLVLTWDGMLMEYTEWIKAMTSCQLPQQLSVMGIIKIWMKIDIPFVITQMIGLSITLLPLLRFKQYSSHIFKQFFLASIMLFIIIFNQMAESPTFIIAFVGIAIWYTSLEKILITDKILLCLAIIFTSLSSGDLFPVFIKNKYFIPYAVKGIPCFIIWIRVQYVLWSYKAVREI